MPTLEPIPPTGEPGHRCGNCDAPLTGPYCAQCGQHAHASARNLAAVLHDFWHDLTHVDGRLWHSLWLLVSRPGYLTAEYFHERRSRYLPPARLYLVLSVLFFAFGSGTHVEVGSPPQSAPAPGAHAKPAAPATAPAPVAAADDEQDTDAGAKFEALFDSNGANCAHIQGGTPWLTRSLRESCTRNAADHGVAYVHALVHNIPKMMFVFLPLVAAVMLLLYWRPRRYYVEHLVFLLHNHSAVFLGILACALVGWVTQRVHLRDGLTAIVMVSLVGYIFWYPYKAMRRYYGQSRTRTLLKYVTISLAYFICLIFTLVGAALVTALEN